MQKPTAECRGFTITTKSVTVNFFIVKKKNQAGFYLLSYSLYFHTLPAFKPSILNLDNNRYILFIA